MTIDELPKPRLQLRWRKPDPNEQHGEEYTGYPPDWICHYEMVIPLRPNDTRRESGGDCLTVGIGTTRVCSSAHTMMRAPFRDGPHALWDSEALGNLPVFIIGSDGLARPYKSIA